MRRIHIVPGLDAQWSGIAVAAKMIAREQGAAIVDADCCYEGELSDADEVWVHSVWTFKVWRACWKAMRRRKRLVRMLHGNVDPVRLRYHGWKKWLVGPIERYFLRRADRIVATCEAEKGWIEAYLGKRCPTIEVTDIKRFFKLQGTGNREQGTGNREQGIGKALHLLYLGRRHPLKGLEYLEEAVRQISSVPSSLLPVPPQLKVVSNAFGEEKERVWEWCDVLVLPTLSENFGLVVAEALERGKRVITTDGAPAWGGDSLEFRVLSSEFRVSSVGVGKNSHVEHVDHVEGEGSLEFRVQSLEFGGEIWSGYGGRLLYLVGYRDGTRNCRVGLLKEAIEWLVASG